MPGRTLLAHDQFSAMSLNDFLRDGESKSCSVSALGRKEWLEDRFNVLGWNAMAVVCDDEMVSF